MDLSKGSGWIWDKKRKIENESENKISRKIKPTLDI